MCSIANFTPIRKPFSIEFQDLQTTLRYLHWKRETRYKIHSKMNWPIFETWEHSGGLLWANLRSDKTSNEQWHMEGLYTSITAVSYSLWLNTRYITCKYESMEISICHKTMKKYTFIKDCYMLMSSYLKHWRVKTEEDIHVLSVTPFYKKVVNPIRCIGLF